MVAYLDDTDEVIKYDGTDWSSVAPAIAGIGSNVVQTVKTDTFSTTSSSQVDVAGVSVSITPTSDTSKVLVTVSGQTGHAGTNERNDIRLRRNSTDIALASGGTSANSVTAFDDATGWAESFTITFLDSPATTSATTYLLRMSTPDGTAYIGRVGAFDRRSVTTITAIEVAA
jgi:hypothetical protein